MVKEIQYTNIRRVLDDLLEDTHMENLTLEQVVKHTIRFIGKHGYPKLYQDKQEDVEIHEFRGVLPCDLVSINQVRDKRTRICLRSMTDTIYPPEGKHDDCPPIGHPLGHPIGHYDHIHPELAFKTQGRIIYTSFPEGLLEIVYKAIPLDEDGFPLLIDNESYLDALEAYISMNVLRNKFRQGKIAAAVYQDAQQVYAVAARELMTEMSTPSLSEMESISRMLTTMIKPTPHFDNGFRKEGDRAYIRNQSENKGRIWRR
jgi:hypothetical protein